jgi:hypothetical protein
MSRGYRCESETGDFKVANDKHSTHSGSGPRSRQKPEPKPFLLKLAGGLIDPDDFLKALGLSKDRQP